MRFRALAPGSASIADLVTAIRELQANPLLDGWRQDDVTLVLGTNTITHPLGRVPTGFLVINADAQVIVTHGAVPTKYHLFLEASAAAVVDLWIF